MDAISALAKGGVVAVAVGIGYLAFNPSPPKFKLLDQPPALTFDQSEVAGEDRAKLIAEAIQQGIFLKARSEGTSAVVETGRAWNGLTFEQKTSIIKGVAAQYGDPNADYFVRIVDGFSGKRIGSFSAKHGGLSLD